MSEAAPASNPFPRLGKHIGQARAWLAKII